MADQIFHEYGNRGRNRNILSYLFGHQDETCFLNKWWFLITSPGGGGMKIRPIVHMELESKKHSSKNTIDLNWKQKYDAKCTCIL